MPEPMHISAIMVEVFAKFDSLIHPSTQTPMSDSPIEQSMRRHPSGKSVTKSLPNKLDSVGVSDEN